MKLRDLFPGFFRQPKEKITALWDTAMIVPDTNILLHFFRYGDKTRSELLATLTSVKSRLWIPHQVAFEFARRWHGVDASARKAYDKAVEDLRSKGRVMSAVFDDYARHPVIDAKAEKKKIEDFVGKICADLEGLQKKHRSEAESEAILNELLSLIGESIGSRPAAEEYEKQMTDGEVRYANKVPPGYADASKTAPDKFGDLFIWEEMVQIARERAHPVIFISDDVKEDWVGTGINPKGPRPELINEFRDRAGQEFYLCSLSTLLHEAKRFTDVAVSREALTEIEEEEAATRHASVAASASKTTYTPNDLTIAALTRPLSTVDILAAATRPLSIAEIAAGVTTPLDRPLTVSDILAGRTTSPGALTLSELMAGRTTSPGALTLSELVAGRTTSPGALTLSELMAGRTTSPGALTLSELVAGRTTSPGALTATDILAGTKKTKSD